MRGILADNDVEGILAAIVPIWLSEVWSDLWSAMGCTIETFASLDLPRDATDAVVWKPARIAISLDHRQSQCGRTRLAGGYHPTLEPAREPPRLHDLESEASLEGSRLCPGGGRTAP